MIPFLTVKQVNERIKNLIENDDALINVVIKGEVANLTNRGHIYMTIKDESAASIKAVLFRGYQSFVQYMPSIGDEVLLYGSIELYVPSGSYQIIVKDVALFGEGKRLIELEKLRKKLQDEGLFNEEHKLQIPKFPKSIGVITARSGAAIHDIVRNIILRYPIADIHFYNSAVQGETAPKELNEALNKAINDNLDVIIIGRGGGDKEDLSAFNDETLVRTIYNSKTPIISAVGHESDYTLVDYVSDMRASTPTDAAIRATPKISDILLRLDNDKLILNNAIGNKISNYKQKLKAIANLPFFINPESYYVLQKERINNIKNQLNNKMNLLLKSVRDDINREEINLRNSVNLLLNKRVNEVERLKIRLTSLNPKALLDKGYSITLDENDNIITSSSEININQTLKTIVKDGIITSNVIKKE